jgi:predicted lipid carrier protein YhbT
MITKEQLIQAIEQAPDTVVEEVFNFLLLTQTRQEQQKTDLETATYRYSAIESDDVDISEGETLLELMERLTANMTEEEIDQLPKDGAEQHDHYIYGIPKTTS